MATSAQLLNQIQEETKEQMQANDAAFVAAQSGANAAAAISEAAAKTLKATADAQATIIREDLISRRVVENAQRSAALAAGYDPATGSGPLLDRIKKVGQKGSEVADLTKKLRAERSVKVWENPMAWLQANFLSDTEEQVVYASQELQAESTTLQNLNAAVQQTARTAEVTAQTVTAAKIEAATKVAATEATLKAYQAEQEGIRYRTAAATAPAELSTAQLASLNTLRNAVLAEQNYKLNLAQEGRAREQFNWMKEKDRIEQEEKKTKEGFDGYVIETINIANKRLQRPEITGMDAKAMLQLLKTGGSDELNRLYHIGMSYRLNPKSGGIIGQDASSALENITKLQAVLTEKEKEVVEILAAAKKEIPAAAVDPKTGKIDSKLYQNAVDARIATAFSQIRPGSGNIFDVGELAPYLEIAPEIQASPFGQKVLLPAIQEKIQLFDPRIVIGMGIDEVRKGNLTMPQTVAGIVATYQKASAIHQGQVGLTSFGIVPPGGGLAQYNVRLGPFNTVNLSDPVAVGRYISSVLGSQAYQDMKANRAKIFKNLPGSQELR